MPDSLKYISMGLLAARVLTAFVLFGILPRNPSRGDVANMVIAYAILSAVFSFVAWLMCPPDCEVCAANRCPLHREGRPDGNGDFNES